MPPQRITQFILSLLLAVWLTSVASASEKLTLASPFTDHAVLQRDMPVPVWGRAEPGAKVVVRFADQEKSATADKDGKWMLKLDRLAASMDGQELSVASGTETTRIKDVLVGEVWLAAGFAEGSSSFDERPELALKDQAGKDVAIRVFEAKFSVADEPQETCQGQWRVPQRKTLMTRFALGVQTKLGVPVGVINPFALEPGTTMASWIRRSALESNPTGLSALSAHQAAVTRFEFVVNLWETKGDSFMKALVAKAIEEDKQNRKSGQGDFAIWPPRKPDPKNHPNLLPDRPSAAFNGMIAPLVPFAIHGVVYNNNHSDDFLIDVWRKEWSPAPLAGIRFCTPWEHAQAELKNNIVRIPTGGILMDRAEALAERATLAALAKVYGVDVEWTAPRCDRVTVDGKKVTLLFTGCKNGLVRTQSDFEGFEVQSTDGVWKRANAELNGDTVIVSSDDVAKPVRVRFGPVRRKDRKEEHELWNKAGFPVEPFDLAVNSKP